MEVDNDDNNICAMINLSLLSKEELIEHLKSTHKATRDTDSASANVTNKTPPPVDGAEDDNSSYESYSGSSCSESSDENQSTMSVALSR